MAGGRCGKPHGGFQGPEGGGHAVRRTVSVRAHVQVNSGTSATKVHHLTGHYPSPLRIRRSTISADRRCRSNPERRTVPEKLCLIRIGRDRYDLWLEAGLPPGENPLVELVAKDAPTIERPGDRAGSVVRIPGGTPR